MGVSPVRRGAAMEPAAIEHPGGGSAQGLLVNRLGRTASPVHAFCAHQRAPSFSACGPRFAPATRPGSGRRQGEGRGPRPAGVGAWPRLPLTWLNDNGPVASFSPLIYRRGPDFIFKETQ
jgi:hypothetical protein